MDRLSKGIPCKIAVPNRRFLSNPMTAPLENRRKMNESAVN